MKNIILFITLVVGVVAGYFIGDYRGREAQEALKKEIATHAALEKEREAIIASLKKDIAGIDTTRKAELDKVQADFEARSAKWEESKNSLDATIKKQTAQLADRQQKIESLNGRIAVATGPEKERLTQELAQLRQQQADQQQEADATRCLASRIPQSVLDALGS